MNGANTHDDTPLSQLMRDMQQPDPDKIKNPILANRMRLLKKGVYLEDMCKELTQERNQGRQEGLKEGLKVGRNEGVSALISTLEELGIAPAAIIAKVAEKFGMSEEDARQAYEKHT